LGAFYFRISGIIPVINGKREQIKTKIKHDFCKVLKFLKFPQKLPVNKTTLKKIKKPSKT